MDNDQEKSVWSGPAKPIGSWSIEPPLPQDHHTDWIMECENIIRNWEICTSGQGNRDDAFCCIQNHQMRTTTTSMELDSCWLREQAGAWSSGNQSVSRFWQLVSAQSSRKWQLSNAMHPLMWQTKKQKRISTSSSRALWTKHQREISPLWYAKVRSSNAGWEHIMGNRGLGNMNENGELFADFCEQNDLVNDGIVLPHRRVRKPDLPPDNLAVMEKDLNGYQSI